VGVREVIGRRLNRLSDHCNELLANAAVIGREFDTGVLGGLSSTFGEDQILELLDEALRASVIEEMPESYGSYRFNHALTQETLLAELSITQQTRKHAKIVSIMEDTFGTESDKHAMEIAEHCAAAETVVGQEKLRHYLIESGEYSLVIHAYDSAVSYFDRAIETTDQECSPEYARMHFGRGRALSAGFDSKAEESLKSAFACYEQLGDTESMIAVATSVVNPTFFLADNADWNVEACSRVLEMIEPGTVQYAYVSLHFALLDFDRVGNDKKTIQALGEVLTFARTMKESGLEMRTLAVWATVDSRAHRHADALEKGKQVVELARDRDDPFAEFLALKGMIVAYRRTGDKRESECLKKYLALAEKLQDKQNLLLANHISAINMYVRGCLDRAMELRIKAGASASHGTYTRISLGDIELERGNLDESRRHYTQAATLLTSENAVPAPYISHLARHSYLTGEKKWEELAEEYSNKGLIEAREDRESQMHARNVKIWLAIAKNDQHAAGELLSQVMNSLIPDSPTFGIIAGLLATTAGDIDAALSHFRKSEKVTRKLGHRLNEYWSAYHYIECLTDRGTPADVAEALALAQKTLTDTAEIGMWFLHGKLEEMIEKLTTIAGESPTSHPVFPDGLTNREVEVLRHIAVGLTNRDIGEKLFISIKTVNTHVRNILEKINAANRTEASVYAMKNRLVDDQTT
jgi:DNA-binding CsgD family transcriptional regulator/tetratricopeptide (TPR) repeat protein